LFLEGPIFATLLRLAAPNILNLVAFVAVITFDGFFLGRIGTNALAGASLAFPWIMLILQTTNSGKALACRLPSRARSERANASAPTNSPSTHFCWLSRLPEFFRQ
jgi:hypothetical protein